MNRKKLQSGKYIAAFIITVLVFVMGLLLGNTFSKQKLDEISAMENDVRIKTMGSEIMYLMLLEDPCSVAQSKEMNEELREIGRKLTYMESKRGKKDEDVLRLKEFYSLLEIRQWLFAKKVASECNGDHRGIILYFYSNLGDCSNCEEQGQILTYAYEKEKTFDIYSFDINIDNPVLNLLKKNYGIRTTPTIVVNDKVYEGFQNTEELLELIVKR